MHIMAERAWIRTRDTRRCSRFQGECLKPDSAISPNLAEAERVERSHPEGCPASDWVGSPLAQRFRQLAVMRGFEPLDPDLHRASDFPGQLFKPLTHITTNQFWRRVFDSNE